MQSLDNRTSLFYGSENDAFQILFRSTLNPTNIVRVTSDCPFIDPNIIDKMLEKFNGSSDDYLANNIPPKTRRFRWIRRGNIQFSSSKRAYQESKNALEREHVTFYIWDPRNRFRTRQYTNKYDYKNYRLTIDYEVDLIVARFLAKELSRLGKFGYFEELIEILDKNPSIKKLNEKHFFGEGWQKDKRKADLKL